MACVYTYEGKQYSEKEFKALLTERLMGKEADNATVINLFTPQQSVPALTDVMKDITSGMKVGEVDKSKTQKAKEMRDGALSFEPANTEKSVETKVRQFFSGGGKVNPESVKKELGLEGEKGEMRERFGMLSNDGIAITELAHQIWEGLPENQKETISDNDVRNTIIDLLNSESRATMTQNLMDDYVAETNAGVSEDRMGMNEEQWKEYKRMQREEEERFIEEEAKKQEDYDAMFTPEVMSTLDAIDTMTMDEIESVYGDAIDENGNIDENKFNEIYEANRQAATKRKGTESKEQSTKTDAQKDNARAEREVKKTEVEEIQDALDDLFDALSPDAQITGTYPFSNVRGNLNKVKKALSKVAPNLTITIVGDSDYIRMAVAAGMTSTEAKKSSAYYDAKTDSIVINRAMGVSNTLTHEAAHPVIAAALNSNPDLAVKFASQLRDVMTPMGMTYGEWVDRNYLAGYSEGDKAIEIVCEFLSNVAIGKHKDLVGQSIWDDFIDFINKLLSSLGVELDAPLSTEQDVMSFAKGFAKALKTGAIIRMEKADDILGKPRPQNAENKVVNAVNAKVVDLVRKGYSVEKIKEAFADEKYKPFRDAVSKHYDIDFDVYVDGMVADATESPKETAKTSFASSVNMETKKEKVKSFVYAVKTGDLTESEKKSLDAELGQFYTVMSHAELEEIGNTIIEEMGGLNKALDEAMNVASTLPPFVRIYILGQAIITKRRQEKLARNPETKNDLADEQIKYADEINRTFNEMTGFMDQMLREMGQAISYIQQFYATSALSSVRRAQKEIDARNAALKKEVTKDDIKKVEDAFEDKAEDNEAALGEVFDGAAMAKTLEQKQAEIDRLEKELEKLVKQKTGTTVTISKKPSKKVDFGIDKKEIEAILKNPLRGLTRNSGQMYGAIVPITKEFVQDMGKVAAYGVQQGIRSFQDFYNFMNKTFKGEGKELYEDIYKQLRQKAAEMRVGEFDNDLAIEAFIQEVQKREEEIKAKKAELEKAKKVNQFGRLLSQPLSEKEVERKSKEQRIIELANELDEIYGSTNFIDAASEYIGITEQEKEALVNERKIAKLEKALEDKEVERKKSIPREQRLRELASELDAQNNTTEYTQKVNEFFAKKASEKDAAANERKIASLEKQLEDKQKERKKSVPREDRLRAMAAELDAANNTNEYTELVDEYFAKKAAEKEQNDLLKEIESFEKKLTPSTPPQRSQVSAEQRLRDSASALDAKTGGTKYTDALNDYLAEKEKAKKTKEFSRMLQPSQPVPARRKREDILRERAAELDAIYGTNAFTRQAEDYLEGKRQEKLSTPTNIANAVKKALMELGYAKDTKNGKVVDWSGVVKGVKDPNKVWEKVDEVLKSTLNPTDYAIQAPLLKTAFFTDVNNRKAKSVQAELDKFNKRKNPLNRARRKSRAEHLVELYRTGALDSNAIKNELSDAMGAKRITDEDWERIEKLIDAIDIAPLGAEKEKLEEELYFVLDELKALHFARNLFERIRGRQLAGFITFFKNAMGVTTANTMIGYKIMINNIKAMVGDADGTIAKVARRAYRDSAYVFLDIAWNGGVDMGSAFSETTGTKEGTPRVRYVEYKRKPMMIELGKRQLNLSKAQEGIRQVDKVFSRALPTVDAFNAFRLQEVESYNFIKKEIKRANPNMSNKEAGRKAYEVMYSITMEEAVAMAAKEFEERGIEITDSFADQTRLKRRAFEIIQQKRGAEATKAGQYYSNRYTFKAHDYGASTVVFLGIMAAKQAIPAVTNRFVVASLNKRGMTKSAQRVKDLSYITNEALFLTVMPFIKGITSVLEKRIELITPYGIAKGAVYTAAAFTQKDAAKRSDAFERAGEYYYRAAVGALASVLWKYLADMFDDDDEEMGKKIGAGGSEDIRDNKVEQTLRTENSITINGRRIPSQAFGTMDLNIIALGIYEDYKREQKRLFGREFNENEADFSLGARIMSSILDDEYLRSTESLYKGFTSENGIAKSGFWNRTLADWITRTTIPATGFIRQTGEVFTPEAKKPIGVMENVWKLSGMSFLAPRKAFDYRGRSYDNADINGNSTRSFITVLGKKAAADEIDKFVYYNNPNITTPSVLDQKFQIRSFEGEERPMTEEEYYDFALSKSQKFGQLIEAYYKTNPESQTISFQLPSGESKAYYDLERDALAELKREGVSVNLNTESGFYKLQEKMMVIGQREAVREKISEDIAKLNTLAGKAAFAEIIAKTKSYYTLDYSLASEEFTELLAALRAMK